jgi:thiol-disulfide isomerase/thioredoxin
VNRIFLAALIASSLSLFALAATPTQPTTSPSADELVRAAIANERWIDHVDSFYVKFEGQWDRSPASIERRTRQLKKQFPGANITPQTFSDVRAHMPETVTLAFDRTRLATYKTEEDNSDIRSFWDGSRFLNHTHYPHNNQESYYIGRSPKDCGEYFFLDLTWLRAGTHNFWFNPGEETDSYRFDKDGARIWRIAGRTNFHGIDCYVLEKEYGWTRWYVGVEHPFLYFHETYVTSNRDSHSTEVMQQVAAAHGASNVKTFKEFEAWKKTLPPPELKAVQEEYPRKLLRFAHPLSRNWQLDYKEVAPNCWMPMTQSYEVFDDDEQPPIVGCSRTLKAVDVRVNQPLPDDLFKMDFKKGVEVYDATHDPPLRYKYKRSFTPDEWQAIVKKAQDDKAMMARIKEDQEAVIGKPAAAFPEKSEWINSKPLKWNDLEGKVVLLDFFADWCGPCRNDLPRSSELFKNRESNKITVIGIHPPGSDRASVQKLIKEFDLQYPVCVDVPTSGEAWGKLYDAYHVKAIPHAVVVGRDGKIAGQGSLAEMIALASKLNSDSK